MMSFYFGIAVGVFVCFAVQRFIVWLRKALKERKEEDLQRTEETLQKLVDKVFEKK